MRRMAAAAMALAMAGLVAGCATGGRGARIREIQEYDTGECRFLGTVESTERSGWDMSDDQLGAMALVRKRASAMGGNAYMLVRGEPSAVGVVVRANVYRCP